MRDLLISHEQESTQDDHFGLNYNIEHNIYVSLLTYRQNSTN